MSGLRVRSVMPAFGAEIQGIDPDSGLGDEDRRLLQQVFDERGLLIFRGLEVDSDVQALLTRGLVGLDDATSAEALAEEGQELPEPHYVSNRKPGANAPYGRLLFHSDMMSFSRPCASLSLYGEEIESPVAPTIFASSTDAWNTLPEELRAHVEGLHAVHGHDETYADRDNDEGDVLIPVFTEAQTAITPVALRHPRTGQTVLFVSQQKTLALVGLEHDASEALLEELFTHLYQPSGLYRHYWAQGDLVVWDNLAVQHARGNVPLKGPARTLRKVIASTPIEPAEKESPRFEGTG